MDQRHLVKTYKIGANVCQEILFFYLQLFFAVLKREMFDPGRGSREYFGRIY